MLEIHLPTTVVVTVCPLCSLQPFSMHLNLIKSILCIQPFMYNLLHVQVNKSAK